MEHFKIFHIVVASVLNLRILFRNAFRIEIMWPDMYSISSQAAYCNLSD